MKKNEVFVKKCLSYEKDELYNAVREAFVILGVAKEEIENKKVVIKPNLVRKVSPDKAVTTHPEVVRAAIKVLKEYGVSDIVIAESPGGVISENVLKGLYNETGIANVAFEENVSLNYSVDSDYIRSENGRICRSFHVLKPFCDADIIVNISKLKTHELTLLSCSVKNYFGTIPGTEKFEMHARFNCKEDFATMLTDLCEAYLENKTTINITDAIVGMEGSGPTAGKPRKMDFIAVSENAFALDRVCEHIFGIDSRVLYLEEAGKRGLCESFEKTALSGDTVSDLMIKDLDLPDTEKNSTLRFSSRFLKGKTIRIFEPKPFITNKCLGCGVCAASCPMHTISIDKEKKKAVIDRKKCIKCYCCQELCPHHAVRIKKNFFLKIIK